MGIIEAVISIIFFYILYLFSNKAKGEVIYVVSDIDNQKYLVRDIKDKQHACNMLARLKRNIMGLTEYLNQNKAQEEFKDYSEYIDQLNDKIQNVVISESGEDSVYTSYSINKGEQIVFCLRSKFNKNKLHDLNLVMYVALHEISHVACPEYGHTDLFKKIFAFITKVAIDKGIYQKIPFNDISYEYCGLMITDSII